MSNTPIEGPLRRDLEAALTTDEFRKAFDKASPEMRARIMNTVPEEQLIKALLGGLGRGR